MSQYQAIKAATNAYIKTNGRQEITGAILNAVMIATIDSLGRFYQFVGKAVPTTDPGTIDQNIAYLASIPGTYEHLGGFTLDYGEVAVIKFDGEWHKEAVATIPAKVSQLENDLGFITNAVSDLVNYYTKGETFTKSEVQGILLNYYDRDEVDSIVSVLTRQSYVVAWDGTAEPVVGDIPAGVSVTWGGNPYVGTLPASASTIGRIYLVSNGAGYDEYITTEDGGYSWISIGTTSIDLSDYATKAEVNQLEAKTGNPLSEYKDIGLPTAGYYDLSGLTVSSTPVSSDRTYSIRTTAKQGDKFKISGLSGGMAILWGFIDSGGNILSKADANTDYRQNPAETTAPSGTEEIIVNFNMFSPLTDYAEKYVELSLTEQVETKTKKVFSLEGQTLEGGYYNLSSSTLPTTRTSSGNYKSIILEGNPGDMFQIVGVSSTSTNARLWATGDASRERVRYSATNQDARTNPMTITLETGEKYLYVNLYLATTGDGVSIIKSNTKKIDLLNRVSVLEQTAARRGLSNKSYLCMRGSLRGTTGLYPVDVQFYSNRSHTPRYIKNYGYFKVNYTGTFGVVFYDESQDMIENITGLQGPMAFERMDAKFFRVYTLSSEERSIEIESYWMGDDEVFQKLPTDEGYQPMAFGVNINKGFVPNDTGASAITTGLVSSLNYGMLHLPASYKEVGTPTPLIIYLHGAADRYEITSTRFASKVRYSPEWDSMGFAQMDVDMVPDVYNTGNSTNVQCGTGDDVACVEAAYNWAIQHFNIRRDGVYLFGRSRGGQAVLECLAKFNPSKLPVVCALSNAGANAMLLYGLFRSSNSTFWRIFCESTGLDALNPPAYSSGLIVANSTIADFLRTNIDIWWQKAMVALPMCVDNPTEYQTPAQIFDLLVSSYTGANPGKTFIEDFIEKCKFRSPVPLRFDWCAGDTIQPWESTSYGNYGSAGKDGFVNNKLTGNSIYRRWPSCPEGDEPHYHELYNLSDYTLPNGETIQNASMAMVEWLLWAMGQDERFTI